MSTVTADQFFIVGGIIVLALILLAIGVVSALRSRTPNPAAHKPVASDQSAPEWLKGLADTAGKTIARAPGAAALPTDALLIMRDPAAGNWLVEINSMRYASLKDIHDDRAASKVLEALAGLQEFAGIKPMASASPIAPAPAPIGALTPAQKPSVEPAIAAVLQAGGPVSSPTYPAPPNSILDQIEKVLQRNLLKYPEMSGRKIHIGAAPDGGLLIEIDRQFYHAVNDVPEENVRNIIHASIQEWERTV